MRVLFCNTGRSVVLVRRSLVATQEIPCVAMQELSCGARQRSLAWHRFRSFFVCSEKNILPTLTGRVVRLQAFARRRRVLAILHFHYSRHGCREAPRHGSADVRELGGLHMRLPKPWLRRTHSPDDGTRVLRLLLVVVAVDGVE